MSKEEDELLLEDGPLAKRLKIALREFKSTKLLDIRYWYQDKSSKEMKPTAKGISLTRSNYLGLRSVATDHHDLIMEYLDVGTLSSSVKSDSIAATTHHVERQSTISQISVMVKTLQPSSKLYEIEYEGAHASVLLNDIHPLSKNLAASEKDGELALNKIAKLLVALDLSIIKLQGGEMTSPDIIFDQLEYDFAKNVRNIELKIK